jgi:hypothetical protein
MFLARLFTATALFPPTALFTPTAQSPSIAPFTAQLTAQLTAQPQVPRIERNIPMDTWPQVPAPAAPPHN